MKYPNAKISQNSNGWYIHLSPSLYLLSDGTAPCWEYKKHHKLTYFPSRESAQALLDKYNYDRDWVALRKEKPHDDYVYIGNGDRGNPLRNFWTDGVFQEDDDFLSGSNWGDAPLCDYYVTIESWNNKFPELAKQFMKQEPTLSEVKTQLEEAKKLVGKTIKILRGNNVGQTGKIVEAKLHLDLTDKSFRFGTFAEEFFNANGYVISLKLDSNTAGVFGDGGYEIINPIIVTNHQGVDYTGVQHDSHWTFGCAYISKTMIKQAYELLASGYNGPGNRQATKVTIGAADFDLETLKKLVDADTNK